MKKFCFGTVITLIAAAAAARAQLSESPLVVTASNATQNQLLVYTASGQLIQTVSTQGKGGASGNAGGIEANGNQVAVVNFGSQSVSLFERLGNTFAMTQAVPAASSPLSVAFGAGHLYILGTTTVESHRMFGPVVNSSPDGVVTLLLADGSAAQVGVLPNQLIISEKTGTIETVNLNSAGAVSGSATAVQNIPSPANAPFGLVTRGDDAYVTIAHSNEITLVRNDKVLTVTNSGTQNAPCWLALEGPFLFSSNSPSKSISRFAVYGQKIVQDAAVAAAFHGEPTDIATADGLVAVIDGDNTVTHLSIFTVDEDGNLTLLQPAATISGAANGIAIVPSGF
jgi:hypothetical protein